MGLDLADYENKARDSVKAFWGNRASARQKQIEAGKADQGERASVTAGKNMDGFIALVLDLVSANGLPNAQIQRSKKVLTLPGFYRPTKLWDLLVMNNGRLVAVNDGNHSTMDETTSLKTFVTTFAAHIAAEAAR